MISEQPLTNNADAADPPTVFGVSQREVLRLLTAYVAIRAPHIRAEFLDTVEAWASEQFAAGDAMLDNKQSP